MSPVGKVYTTAQKSFKTRRALAVAAFAGLEVELPAFTFGETNKSEEFLAKFPLGKIPALETADNLYISEGAAIAYYFAAVAPNANLLGDKSPETLAKIAQWNSFADLEISERLGVANGMVNGYIPWVKPVYQNRIEKALSVLPYLDAYLSKNTFLVGHRITLADITVASVLADGFSRFFGPEERKQFPNVFRFEQTVVNHPKIASAFEGVSVATEAYVYSPPKKEAAPKPAKEAVAPKPKAAPVPKAKEPEEEEEESFADAPKAKNPLDSLPKSTFNLEDWKRAYSNMDTRGADGAIEWFYKNFDAEGFSIWRFDFKYNEELTMTFMSNNQLGGFFNRLEGSRKYAFASAGVLGVNNASIITGVLVVRGQEIEPVVSVAPDYESYSYKRLDISNADDKAFFEGALAWDLSVDGKQWADGKNFK